VFQGLFVPDTQPRRRGQVSKQCARNFHRRVSRVFTLRACSGCASNLLTLFERVDKAAVELFIVHGTNGNGVLTANTRAAPRDYRVRAFFTPPPDTFPVAGSLFPPFSLLPALSHLFPPCGSLPSERERERARARADSGARRAARLSANDCCPIV